MKTLWELSHCVNLTQYQMEHIMQDFIQQTDPEGFAAYVKQIVNEEWSK